LFGFYFPIWQFIQWEWIFFGFYGVVVVGFFLIPVHVALANRSAGL
jgi:hypothetical protein